uniref:DUF2946 family protein n=1 Tax=Castellaniella defragrans TaxID=75697 RepID=UPI00333E36FC
MAAMKTGWRSLGIHWLLILGIWLQSVGPVFARPVPVSGFEGLQIIACTPAGMVVMDLSSDESDSGQTRVHQTGHCLLCATTPALPTAAIPGAAQPAALWAQPLLPAITVADGGPQVVAWIRPPVRSPPAYR